MSLTDAPEVRRWKEARSRANETRKRVQSIRTACHALAHRCFERDLATQVMEVLNAHYPDGLVPDPELTPRIQALMAGYDPDPANLQDLIARQRALHEARYATGSKRRRTRTQKAPNEGDKEGE